LVPGELLDVDLRDKVYKGTGHLPGVHTALLMPRYTQSVATCMVDLPDAVILREGHRMVEAVSAIHDRGYVHMDIKVCQCWCAHDWASYISL
jgi:hypothetical protein